MDTTHLPRGHHQTKRAVAPSARPRAFTLVELLVVIGIIALLVSILLPSLNRARENAKQVQCESNLRQLGMAFVGYVNDNKGRFPSAAPRDPVPQTRDNWLFWEDSGPRQRDIEESPIATYLSKPMNKNVLRCPSDNAEDHAKYFDPPYKFSYVFNSLIHNYYQEPPNTAFPQDIVITRIHDSTSKIMLVEEDEYSINDGWWAPGAGGPDWLAIRHDYKRVAESPGNENPRNLDRRGNAAFCDGHVDYITRRQSQDPFYYDPAR